MEPIAPVNVLLMFMSKMEWFGEKNNRENTELQAMLPIMALEAVRKV